MVYGLVAPFAIVVAINGDQLLVTCIGIIELPRVRRRNEEVLSCMEEDCWNTASPCVFQGHHVLNVKVGKSLDTHPNHCQGCGYKPRGHRECHPVALRKLLG